MSIYLILPAGGIGVRFNSVAPKQFITINNKEILEYTLEKWLGIKEITQIFIPLPENYYHEKSDYYQKLSNKVTTLIGGKSRTESIFNALKKIKIQKNSESLNKNLLEINRNLSEKRDLVLIHDAVRPFFTKNLVYRVLDLLKIFNAVIPILPIYDTVKKVNKSFVIETLNRDELGLVQTPQGFDFEKIYSFYIKNCEESFFDDAQLMESNGVSVAHVLGESRNIKITTPEQEDFINFLINSEK